MTKRGKRLGSLHNGNTITVLFVLNNRYTAFPGNPMTGPLTWCVYRTNWLLLETSRVFVGMLFDPCRDIVLVTGGSSGLGKELASAFRQKGATVVVFDINLPGKDNQNYVEGVHYYYCDVSNPDMVKERGNEVRMEVGQVTVLINNAGITTGNTLLDLSFDEIETTLAVNLLSSFYTIKTFLPGMLDKRRGYIVTIASTLGYMSPARLSVYGASKSGLITLHESLNYELGPPTFNTCGVKTLLVCPGQLKTYLFGGVRTPSTLFAPELDPRYVANHVIRAVSYGCRGEVKLPFYGNVLPIFRSIPWPAVAILRYISGINNTMKKFVQKARETTNMSTSFMAEKASMFSRMIPFSGGTQESMSETPQPLGGRDHQLKTS